MQKLFAHNIQDKMSSKEETASPEPTKKTPTPSKSQKQSNRPQNTPFRQQKLKAWQPILTPRNVVPTFLIVGVVFIIIGPLLLQASGMVIESTPLRYDDKDACDVGKSCLETITLPNKMSSPVYMYYQLTNFYQNHRRYVKSRNDAQLRGITVEDYTDISDCAPLRSVDESTEPADFYYPCGLIAASFFNDTFTDLRDPDGKVVDLKKKGIAWQSDVDVKFKNPDTYTGVPPLGMENFPDNTDEDFIVWMRTAALPNFRKLYRIIESDLEAGDYKVNITSKFPVSSFSGTKTIVLSTVSSVGGKNDFLGYAFLVVGILTFVLGLIFTLKHKTSPRKLGDTKYLLWNK